jgi:hypothetical protein
MRQILRIRIPFCHVGILAASLGGCTSVQSYLGDPYVEPAKFQYLRCKDIGARILEAENRRVQLQALMDRAANGTGGSAVNLLVYRPEFEQVDAQLRLLRQTAGEKRCSSETTNPAPPTLTPVH